MTSAVVSPARAWLLGSLVAAAALAVACGGGDADDGAAGRTAAVTPVAAEARASAPGDALVLAAGRIVLPSAGSFNDRGFQEVLTATHQLPADLRVPPGARLVLSLRDARRPAQRCGQEHPLSGCATVDWSDAAGRPHVPAGGVFDSHITMALVGGSRAFFLSESGALADAPDAFSPG